MIPGFSLAVTIALREMRGGLSGFRILVACLALGVAAIAVLEVSARVLRGYRRMPAGC